MRLSWRIDKITTSLFLFRDWPSHCATLLSRKTELGIYNKIFLNSISFEKAKGQIIDWGRDYRSSALKCWWMHIQNLPKSQIYLFSKCQFDCNPISNSIVGNFSPYIFATIEPHFPHLDCLIYSNKKHCRTPSFSCCALQFRPPEIERHRHQVSFELPGHLSWKMNILKKYIISSCFLITAAGLAWSTSD